MNWYGGQSVNNDGSFIPTLIRIAGYLSEEEFNGGKSRLAVFFSGLEPFIEPES